MLMLTLLLALAPTTHADRKPEPPAVFCASVLRAASLSGHDFNERRVALLLDGVEIDHFLGELTARRDQIKKAVGGPAHYRATVPNLVLSGGVTGGLMASLPFLSGGSFAGASAALIALALTDFPTYPFRWLASRDRSYAELVKSYEAFRVGRATEFGWRRRLNVSPEFVERLADGAGAPDVTDEIERQVGTPFSGRARARTVHYLNVAVYADRSPRMMVEIDASEPGH